MAQLARGASRLVALSLLTSAGVAYAEEASVVWRQDRPTWICDSNSFPFGGRQADTYGDRPEDYRIRPEDKLMSACGRTTR